MKIKVPGFSKGGSDAAVVFLLLFLFCFSSCFSQSGAGTVPPPGHLPRMLWECESGAGFSSCSVWMWHGSSYSAIWSNGNTGQLTVASGDAPELRVQRVDKTGLTASYTGKWDGKSVSDGKLTFAFKAISGAGVWTGVPEVTPIAHSSLGSVMTVEQQERSYFEPPNAPYINWYTADLTGFTIRTHGMPGAGGVSTVIEDYRTRGENPMKAGERRQLSLKAMFIPPDYEKGADYRYGEAIAAIYSDGATFGDRNILTAMIDNRRNMIAALTGIGSTLCVAGSRQASIADVAAALDKQHAAEDARSAAGKEARDAAYSEISKFLGGRDNNRLPANKAIQRTFERVNVLRSGLAADPVKDATGRLLIPPVSPLACSLP